MGSSSQNTSSTQSQQSSANQSQQSQSQSAPWQPTQAQLATLLAGINGTPTTPTAAQNWAVSNLGNAANTVNGFSLGNQAQTNAYNAGTALPNWLTGLFGNIQHNLSPLTNPNNLNPLNTPGFSQALAYQNQLLGNQINGQFAGAGRDLSPANSQAYGYGLGGADAAAIAQQYNANVNNALNANNAVFNAGANTANFGLNANTGATNILNQIPGLATAGPSAQLQAAQTAFGLPFSNIGTAEGMILPIAGLGGQTSGTGSGQTSGTASGQSNSTITSNPSLLAQILAPLSLGGNSIGNSLFSSGFNKLGGIFG